ncbi:MAG TPA: radical SAM protein [Anaerolineaceae bacterium]|nr:radical SAM protein [Anaerolineaceae bacterium]
MNCPTCPEVSLGEWGDGLVTRLQGKRFPLNATFEITDRCNMACVHCFINKPASTPVVPSIELTYEHITRILDQTAEAGCLNLLLTGGEVLLRPDFCEIYKHAKSKGMLVMVFTNGTLLTPKIADVMAEYPPYFMEITIYGHTKETYEKVTRVPGSYERCHAGIDLALERGLKLGLKTMVLTVNRHELKQMREYADSLGVPFRYDAMLWPRLDGGKQPYGFQLSPQEIVDLDRNDIERVQKWKQLHRSISKGMSRKENVYNCGAGVTSFHVDSHGKMSMCMAARHPSYDLLTGSILEGWQFLDTVRQKKKTLDTPCQDCEAGILCSQCAGWSQMVHGDDETPAEFICELGRLRTALVNALEK